MTVRLLLFAQPRDIVGAADVEIQVAGGATIATLREIMSHRWPDLAPILASSRFALNNSFVNDDEPLVEHGELALIPPVSGG